MPADEIALKVESCFSQLRITITKDLCNGSFINNSYFSHQYIYILGRFQSPFEKTIV
jgi:hypothetical protein